MSNENPTENPREVFDENETGVAQKEQEIAKALEAKDYGNVAKLAEEAEGMKSANKEIYEKDVDEALETNKGIDEAKAAEEKDAREAVLAEAAKLDAENSQKEAAMLLEKMQGGNGESSIVEETKGEAVEKKNETENEIKTKEDWDRSSESTGETNELLSIYEQSHNQIAKEKLITIARELEKQGQEFMTADIFEKIGWKDDAKRLYNKVTELAYKDKSYLEVAAEASKRLGREDQSKRLFKEYADGLWKSQTPESSSFLFRLAAEAYEKAGRESDAKTCWGKYADKLFNDEEFKQTLNYYPETADAYEKAGDIEKAEELRKE